MSAELAAPQLVLASESPRRRELLAELGVTFTVRPAAIDERSDEPDPVRRATALALAKASAVARRESGALVLGADTIVVAPDGELLGKPSDAATARAMLGVLRGREHRVVTGVAAVLVRGAGAATVATEAATTVVRMRAYSDAEVARYVTRGEPFDKAGGYAIQDPELAPAASAEGCVCSVIGLPLWSARRLLAEVGELVTRAPALDRCAGCPLHDGPDTSAP